MHDDDLAAALKQVIAFNTRFFFARRAPAWSGRLFVCEIHKRFSHPGFLTQLKFHRQHDPNRYRFFTLSRRFEEPFLDRIHCGEVEIAKTR